MTTAWNVAASVPDPEIPVLDIAEMGILRSVEVDETGHVIVTITPTYSGCPAMEAIQSTILDDLGNLLVRQEHTQDLPGKVELEVQAGDILSMRTPGGGGWGEPQT